MSDQFRMGLYKPVQSESIRAANYIRASTDYARLGIDCFNACVDPDQDVKEATLRGMEKRCMDGCATVKLQNFTIYGTQYGN